MKRLQEMRKAAEGKSFTIKFAGYRQSKRGNEELYRLVSFDGLTIVTGSVSEITKQAKNRI